MQPLFKKEKKVQIQGEIQRKKRKQKAVMSIKPKISQREILV